MLAALAGTNFNPAEAAEALKVGVGEGAPVKWPLGALVRVCITEERQEGMVAYVSDEGGGLGAREEVAPPSSVFMCCVLLRLTAYIGHSRPI